MLVESADAKLYYGNFFKVSAFSMLITKLYVRLPMLQNMCWNRAGLQDRLCVSSASPSIMNRPIEQCFQAEVC